jgi:hypothetical protein
MVQIRERQKELLNEAGRNPTDSEYRKYAEAAKKAEEILVHRR